MKTDIKERNSCNFKKVTWFEFVLHGIAVSVVTRQIICPSGSIFKKEPLRTTVEHSRAWHESRVMKN